MVKSGRKVLAVYPKAGVTGRTPELFLYFIKKGEGKREKEPANKKGTFLPGWQGHGGKSGSSEKMDLCSRKETEGCRGNARGLSLTFTGQNERDSGSLAKVIPGPKESSLKP